MTPKRKLLSQYLAQIEAKMLDLYGAAYKKILNLDAVRSAIESGDEEFSFKKHPAAAKQLERQLESLATKVSALTINGVRGAFAQGEDDAQNSMVHLMGTTTSNASQVKEISQQATNQYREQGMNARNYVNQKRGGFTVSDRIWNATKQAQQEMEITIQNGIIEGQSAAEISRGIRGNLLEPHRLFRSVRDKETGQLRLSKAAREYHPGEGVYRSSYKNAMRVARSEVNNAYRSAEWLSYSNNPLVKGYEIRLSNNHTTLVKGKPVPFHDICDELAGIYPAEFQWAGWHPQCRCAMIPIPLTPQEFAEYTKAKREGRLAQWELNKPTIEMPKQFTEWIENNHDRIKDAKSLPYFIRDNFKDGNIDKGLAFDIMSAEQRFLLQVKARHEARTPEQIEDIKKRWAEHREREVEIKRIQSENSKPYYLGRFADDIDACSTFKELDEFMVKNGVAKSTSFGKMNLEDAKQVCKVAAEMQSRFSLRSIDIKVGGTSRSNWYMRANGSHVEINSGFWRGDKIADTLRSGFYNSVSHFVDAKRARVKSMLDTADSYSARADAARLSGDKSQERWYRKEEKKLRDSAEKLQEMLDAGVNRFNQFLSRETMLRDCFAHEMGHVAHDQVTGGINGTTYLRKRYSKDDAIRMNNDLSVLSNKYKSGDNFVTEYGMTNSHEFLSESMVLYMYRRDKLPQDVQDWFQRLELMAHGGKLPVSKISYAEAYEIYKNKHGREAVLEAAKKRHETRTPEQIEKIKADAKKISDRWAEDRFVKRVANISRAYIGDKHADDLLEALKRNTHEEAYDYAVKTLKNIRKHVRHGRLALADAEAVFKGIDNAAVSGIRKALADKNINGIDAAVKAVNDEIYKVVKQYDGFATKDEIMKFGASAVGQAKMAVYDKLSDWSSLSLEQQKKKIEFQIQYVEHPEYFKSGVQRFETWELTQREYQKALKSVEVKIEWQSFDNEFAALKQYSSLHKSKQGKSPTKIEILVDEIEYIKANGGSIGDAKAKLAQANEIKAKNEASVKSHAKAKAAKDAQKVADIKAKIADLEKEVADYEKWIADVLSGKNPGTDKKWTNYDDRVAKKEIEKLKGQLSKLGSSAGSSIGARLDDDAFFAQVERLCDKYYPKAITTYKKKTLGDVLSAVKAKDRKTADALLKSLGYDMDDPYSQARKDSAIWDIGDGSLAEEVLHKDLQRVWKSASNEEKAYAYEYTHHFRDVNEPLNGIVYRNAQDRNRWEEKVNAIESFIEKSSMEQDVWFQRYDSDISVIMSRIKFAGGTPPSRIEDAVGMVIQNGGFLSAGSQRGKGLETGRVVTNIYAPKGTKGVYIEPFSHYGKGARSANYDGVTRYNTFSNEHETLFQRGTRMRITKVEVKGSYVYIDVEIIGRELKDLSYVDNKHVSSVTY